MVMQRKWFRRRSAGLDRNKVQYKILKEIEREDGSILMEIKKQYNASPVGEYLK